MPPFPKPTTRYVIDVARERLHLRAHRRVRGIPAKAKGSLLIGSWNIANLGLQVRRAEDRALLAEVMGWFDVVAVQECRENIADLYDILDRMGPRYRVVMSDVGGNQERLAFLYDGRKLALLDEIGEVTVAPAMARHIVLPLSHSERSEESPTGHPEQREGSPPVPPPRPFTGFDRPPYLAAFQLVGTPLSVQLINVHLYFGSPGVADVERRALETTAIARWMDLRQRSPYAGARELIALGDFNMPKPRRNGGNIVYDALTRRGLVLPLHSGQIGSSIASDNFYDQVALFPATTKRWLVQTGVFDFDAAVFPDLWARGDRAAFNAYLRYYLSDHRPMWVQIRAP